MKYNKDREKSLLGLIFIFPAIFLIFVFLILPGLMALIYSFYKINLLNPSVKEFIGIKNYQQILADPSFYKALGNTFYFALVVVPLQCSLALLLAILVNKKLKTSKIARIAFFSPVVTSIVVISILWTFLYNVDSGLFNGILSSLGLPKSKFLTGEGSAMNSIIIMSAWQAAGYQMMIFLAGLQDISPDLYEAAELDGANTTQKFWNVTIPGLSNVIPFVVLITTIQAFKLFTQPFVMTQGGPNESTTTIVYMIFQQGFQFRNVGYSSAIAVIFFVLILFLSVLMKKYLMKDEG